MADGWRERSASGDLVLDVSSGVPVVEGLPMIHSPRLHEGRLWWLNSGSGSSAWSIPWALGSRLLRSARAMRVASPALPHSVVDVSLARENRKFLGLPLDAALSSRGVEARCGLLMVNTRSGDIVEMLRLKGVKEQFDVAVPAGGGRNLSAIGFRTEEIQRLISMDDTTPG